MQVLLTGATGYIGSAVAQTLEDEGHSVIALSRSAEAAERAERAGLAVASGDLNDLRGLAALASDHDAVVHCAFAEEGGATDAAAVHALVSALAGTGKALVYTSGVWVLGDTGGRTVDERAPVAPAPLVAWRPAVEEEVMAAERKGVRTTVIRPGLVYGDGGGIPQLLLRRAREQGFGRLVGAPAGHWSFVHREALALLYAAVLRLRGSGGLVHGVSDVLASHDVSRAAAEAAGATETRPWSLPDARDELGALADALWLDQRVSSRRAPEIMAWPPKAPSVFEELAASAHSAQLTG